MEIQSKNKLKNPVESVPEVKSKITSGQISIANQISELTELRGFKPSVIEAHEELQIHGVSHRVVEIKADGSLHHRLEDSTTDYGGLANISEAVDFLSSRKFIAPGISVLKNKVLEALLSNGAKADEIYVVDIKTLRGRDCFSVSLKGNPDYLIKSGIYHALGINIGSKTASEYNWDFASIDDASKMLIAAQSAGN